MALVEVSLSPSKMLIEYDSASMQIESSGGGTTGCGCDSTSMQIGPSGGGTSRRLFLRGTLGDGVDFEHLLVDSAKEHA